MTKYQLKCAQYVGKLLPQCSTSEGMKVMDAILRKMKIPQKRKLHQLVPFVEKYLQQEII